MPQTTVDARRRRIGAVLGWAALAGASASCVASGRHLAAHGPGAVTLAAIERMESYDAPAGTAGGDVDGLSATSRWMIGFCTAASGTTD
ncbi:hypothetical protein [Engelhardtia mirabilis]|uniref:Uncharacterized protein n=1 Tax=Engelhardtia mirabilis TaxID=2528011 RepID=A0A518BNY3_9BACT|nr:hypothetical protein Pla133_37450 [Planctomycetes bacterium Pla133]QDV02970.1 hypothetical protein Pla86_37440 [Planctomycetes bacterium Pla86]